MVSCWERNGVTIKALLVGGVQIGHAIRRFVAEAMGSLGFVGFVATACQGWVLSVITFPASVCPDSPGMPYKYRPSKTPQQNPELRSVGNKIYTPTIRYTSPKSNTIYIHCCSTEENCMNSRS